MWWEKENDLCYLCIHSSDESDQSCHGCHYVIQVCLEYFLLFKTFTLFMYFVCLCAWGCWLEEPPNSGMKVRGQHLGIHFPLLAISLGDQTQISRLGGKCPYLVRHLTCLRTSVFMPASEQDSVVCGFTKL